MMEKMNKHYFSSMSIDEINASRSDALKWLESLAEHELDEIEQQLNLTYSQEDTFQMGIKILLNSAYGAMGNQFFRYYDLKLAEAITYSGQLSIRWIIRKVNEYLNDLIGSDNIDFIPGSDTDSTVYETVLRVNNTNIQIGELYEKYANDSNLICQRDSNDFIHDISMNELQCKSMDDNFNIIDDKILKIMKHEVTKEMFKIADDVTGQNIIVTCDHSIIVKNKITRKLEDIKPNELDSKKHEIICVTEEKLK